MFPSMNHYRHRQIRTTPGSDFSYSPVGNLEPSLQTWVNPKGEGEALFSLAELTTISQIVE